MSWQWRMMHRLKRNWLVVSKLTLTIWRILTRAPESLKNLHFNGLFLTKIYNVWAKKAQRSYVWYHWRLVQNLKKNWLALSKMTLGIWEIFTGWKMFMIVASEKLIWKFCETISRRTFKKSMVNVTASYSPKHFLL